MEATRVPMNSGNGEVVTAGKSDVSNSNDMKKKKPQFRPTIDDSKPLLQDPILRSDPIETEEAVLRLPAFK